VRGTKSMQPDAAVSAGKGHCGVYGFMRQRYRVEGECLAPMRGSDRPFSFF
jgi:hypothetical protein